jgi:hypothetical protein
MSWFVIWFLAASGVLAFNYALNSVNPRNDDE